MPLVQIDLLEGRTIEQKRALVEKITDVISEIAKCPKEDVTIIFRDMPTHNLGKAGILRCDRNK